MMVEVGLKGKSPCPDLLIDPGSLTELFAFPTTVVDTTQTLGCYSEREKEREGHSPLPSFS